MSCCRYHAMIEGGCETAFTVDPPLLTFGPGSSREVGPRIVRHLVESNVSSRRVAVFTDPVVRDTEVFDRVLKSLGTAACDAVVYDGCRCEPTSRSVEQATRFAKDGRFDAFISVGGGSVMDTCKIANLLASQPLGRASFGDELMARVNAPIGEAVPVVRALKPHIACPTTSGTGSESTGIAILDLSELGVKSGIASRFIRPTEAVVDPDATRTLPRMVLACSAFDVLCHALESYTARPYTARPLVTEPASRPASQGANPWSDMGCREALRLLGRFMERGVNDASDTDARAELMWAATLAGIAFGNAGVHAPHGMSYAIAGKVREYRAPDYPDAKPMVPHGMSVVLTAPAVFEHTAGVSPERHAEAALLLGADGAGATTGDAGELLSGRLRELMKSCSMPSSLAEVGYERADVDELVEGAYAQQRLLSNAPLEFDRPLLAEIFSASM